MLATLGLPSLEALVEETVPAGIRRPPLNLPDPKGEHELLDELRALAQRNEVFRSFIGMGYHGTITPAVIQRNVLENPAWYTAYTPYQAEIAQGRLEALLNFQTMIADLTALPLANASLLDESTAAAEAMHMCHAAVGAGRRVFLVAEDCHPQTIAVLRTRAEPLGLEVRVGDPRGADVAGLGAFGVLVQYPTTDGRVVDYEGLAERVHAGGALLVVAADILALTLLRPPGEFGADVAVGSSQRFGVPMGFGGPHAAFLATRDALKRQMPGRIIGVSKDAEGRTAYRMALQTREQHIRREKATSNICTAQVLLAVMAAMYAVYHGPEGLRRIARRVHALTVILAVGLKRLGFEVGAEPFFDTLRVRVSPSQGAKIRSEARARRINLRAYEDGSVGISLDETTAAASPGAALRRVLGRTPRGLHPRGPRPGGGLRPPGAPLSPERVPDPRGLQSASLRARDAPLHAAPPGAGPLPRDVHDPPGLLHDEAQRQLRDGPGDVARVRTAAPLRPRRADPGLRRALPPARVESRRDHGPRVRLPPAQRRVPGRVRRASHDPGVPREPRREGSDRLPHPRLRPRNEPRERGHGGLQGGRRGVRRPRQHRPRRPAEEGRGASRRPRRAHGHLPVHPRGLRGIDPRGVRDRPRERRPGVHGRREHERPGRAHEPRRHRGRRLPPESPQDVLHSPRRRRAGDGAHRRGRPSRPTSFPGTP